MNDQPKLKFVHYRKFDGSMSVTEPQYELLGTIRSYYEYGRLVDLKNLCDDLARGVEISRMTAEEYKQFKDIGV